MKQYTIDKFLNNPDLVKDTINQFMKEGTIVKNDSLHEIKGHLLKSEHNMNFISFLDKSEFLDWAITGCYYAAYHAALALIISKGYFSKNHLATLLILIKEFYKKELNKQDIESLNNILDYEDILFYVESKNKRENASYSTNIMYDQKELSDLRLKTISFVSRVKEIMQY